MDYCGIQEALVFHSLALFTEARLGNTRLVEEIEGQSRLYPCWVILPPSTGEIAVPQALVEELETYDVRAVRMFPRRIGPLREFLYGELLETLAAHRVPLMVDYELVHYSAHQREVDWEGLRWGLESYPDLPFILPRIGQGVDRVLLPLMERYGNLYIEISYYIGHGGLRRLSQMVGAERLLFGTGMPLYAPGPAITLLTYSGLDERAQWLIGGGNLRRLLRLEGKG
jgi:predicted TIM-barrel fold metal-dependent hydrolase